MDSLSDRESVSENFTLGQKFTVLEPEIQSIGTTTVQKPLIWLNRLGSGKKGTIYHAFTPPTSDVCDYGAY